MVRSLYVGITDYSHQSLADMIEDLGNWVLNLTKAVKDLEESDTTPRTTRLLGSTRYTNHQE